MSYIISIKKDNTLKLPKQDISKSRKRKIQRGAGKTDNVTLEISKKVLDLPSDMYLQGPKENGIKAAKEIIKEMKKDGKNPCKKAVKYLKRFINDRKDGSKPSEDEVTRAVLNAFILHICDSKHVKLTNRDLSKRN